MAVLELDSSTARTQFGKPNLDLAGACWVCFQLPLRADVPAEEESVRGLEGEHSGPAALGAIHASVVDVAACVGLEYRLLDLDIKQVMVPRLDPIKILSEDAESALDRYLDHGLSCDRGRLRCDCHCRSSISLSFSSSAMILKLASAWLQNASSSTRSRARPSDLAT